MNKILYTFYTTLVFIVLAMDLSGQIFDHVEHSRHEYTPEQIEYLINKTLCIVDDKLSQNSDTVFAKEKIIVVSDELAIAGMLYLPDGARKYPLVILANSGGLDKVFSKTFPNSMYQQILQCNIACFIYDPRGIGESEGNLRTTTYDNYITDVGNVALFLANHPNIDSSCIGVIGYSEGGRIAVLSANRFQIIKYAVSVAGSVVSTIDDRIYAQRGWLESLNLSDYEFNALYDLHKRTILAWKDNNIQNRNKIDEEISIIRNKYDSGFSPITFDEFYNNPQLERALPAWNSIQFDYLSELKLFNKKWLAVFGNEDMITPTKQSIENIRYYMSLSKNPNYFIANIDECGHDFININMGYAIQIEALIINWIAANVLDE